MNLYLMRHGEAISPSDWPGNDATRPLSALGQARLESAVQKMLRLQFSFSRLLTSPFVRAKQTADVLEEAMNVKSVVCPELVSGSTLPTLKALIERFKSEPSILVVGHMPDLAVFGSRVATEPSVIERGLQPGEMLALEADLSNAHWGQGRVLWYRSLDEWEKVQKFKT